MTRIEELWAALRSGAAATAPAGDGAQLVQIDPQHPFDIYAGVDGNGAAMFAIGTSVRPPVIAAGTEALAYFSLQRGPGRWFMGLRLAGSALEGVFGRLCQDLADTAAGVGTEAALVALFRARLQLWKRLFRDGGPGLLKRHEIRELFAELLALADFIDAAAENPLQAVACWKNPGAAQDFVFPDQRVEVASTTPGAGTVGIASVLQLDAPVPLTLRVCELRESAVTDPGALTLPLLVTRTAQMLGEEPNALNALYDRLLAAGYVEHDHYRSVAFVPLATRHYAVSNGFPRLVRATLPDGIADASYTILFSSIEAFQIPEHSHAA